MMTQIASNATRHRGGQKQPFDIVALIKRRGEFADLVRRGGGAGHVVTAAVYAVLAVVRAFDAHQDL